MASAGAADTGAQRRRTTGQIRPTGIAQRDAVRPASRLPLEAAAARLAAVEIGVWLLPRVAARRNAAADESPAAHLRTPAVGTARAAQRGGPGFSVGQDDGKGGPRGYDAGKKVSGRKRHLLVDTQGFLLRVYVPAANVQDRDGARTLLKGLGRQYPRLRRLWADGAYAGRLQRWVARGGAGKRMRLEIIKRSDAKSGFQVQPRRWVVERTLAWLGRSRRLSKDYEQLTQTSEALIYLAMTHLLVRRIAPGAF